MYIINTILTLIVLATMQTNPFLGLTGKYSVINQNAEVSHVDIKEDVSENLINFEDDRTTINYIERMAKLVTNIGNLANKAKPDFIIVTNNGFKIFDARYVNNEVLYGLFEVVNGVLIEEFFYGWEMQDDKNTSKIIQEEILQHLSAPMNKGIPIFNVDYCSNNNTADAYEKNNNYELISFVAPSRNLDMIPNLSSENKKNNSNISDIAQVKNFLILLNPEAYSTKEKYLTKLGETNYDLLIIDAYYESILTKTDLEKLKIKQNGGKRKVIAYLSIGEAEDYREYWQQKWNKNPPFWMEKPNKVWEGNYKVKYWDAQWQLIVYSYLMDIIKAGFDGVFLDVIDAYEYFE